MNDLQLFYNETFGKLRGYLDKNDNPWFVAVDVCTILELGNPRSSLALLDEDEKGVHTVDTPGGSQEMTIINEPGLYSLMLRSRKPEAKTFKHWICHEVIPAIRKTGEYKQQQVKPQIATKTPGDFRGLFNYVVTLRQLARLSIYPPFMRASFLAEAASLLSGQPMSRYLPPLAAGRESWEPLSVLAKRYGLPPMELSGFLMRRGLHGRQDCNHNWSQPIWRWPQNGQREFVFYLYDPEALRPHLEEYAAFKVQSLLFQ